MAGPYFHGETLDDLMHEVFGAILSDGEWVKPSNGGCTELMGVILELTDPRARLSRTETRGKPFSCLGELCWYLAGTNNLDFISYYISFYKDYANNEPVFGGYGPRLFDWKGTNQFKNITDLLTRKPSSRQAVIQLFDACDIMEDHKDIPCTCTLQFMIRNEKLHMITYMRSNDAYLGLPHDFFAFTMIQEIMARALSVELGTYKHAIGSLHIYDEHKDAAQQFLDEGWQSTELPMPPMPLGDPWPSIRSLLSAEASIRTDNPKGVSTFFENLDPYWADLIRLLQAYRYGKDKNHTGIEEVRRMISSPTYHSYIDKKRSDHHR